MSASATGDGAYPGPAPGPHVFGGASRPSTSRRAARAAVPAARSQRRPRRSGAGRLAAGRRPTRASAADRCHDPAVAGVAHGERDAVPPLAVLDHRQHLDVQIAGRRPRAHVDRPGTGRATVAGTRGGDASSSRNSRPAAARIAPRRTGRSCMADSRRGKRGPQPSLRAPRAARRRAGSSPPAHPGWRTPVPNWSTLSARIADSRCPSRLPRPTPTRAGGPCGSSLCRPAAAEAYHAGARDRGRAALGRW
jgi:hypothetical protein